MTTAATGDHRRSAVYWIEPELDDTAFDLGDNSAKGESLFRHHKPTRDSEYFLIQV